VFKTEDYMPVTLQTEFDACLWTLRRLVAQLNALSMSSKHE